MDSQQATKTDRVVSLDHAIDQLRGQLDTLKIHLMNEPTEDALHEFDSATGDMLIEAFGSSSPILDTYEYAQVGESAGLLNLTDGGPEGANPGSQRETLRQRQRVVESGIADLEARRASVARETRKGKATGPRVSDYMAKSLRSISEEATLREAGQALQKWKIGSVLVENP